LGFDHGLIWKIVRDGGLLKYGSRWVYVRLVSDFSFSSYSIEVVRAEVYLARKLHSNKGDMARHESAPSSTLLVCKYYEIKCLIKF
jgi:hypothetical protein